MNEDPSSDARPSHGSVPTPGQNRPSRWERPIVVNLALALCMIVLVLCSSGRPGGGTLVFSALAVLSILAAVLRFGWVYPCTILGLLIAVLPPRVGGGPADVQMWEELRWIAFCIGSGLMIGFIIDGAFRGRNASMKMHNDGL